MWEQNLQDNLAYVTTCKKEGDLKNNHKIPALLYKKGVYKNAYTIKSKSKGSNQI